MWPWTHTSRPLRQGAGHPPPPGRKSEKPCPRIAVTSADLGIRPMVRMESPGEAGTSEWRSQHGRPGEAEGRDRRWTAHEHGGRGTGRDGVVSPTATTAVRPIPGLRGGRAAAEPPRPASRGDLPSPLRPMRPATGRPPSRPIPAESGARVQPPKRRTSESDPWSSFFVSHCRGFHLPREESTDVYFVAVSKVGANRAAPPPHRPAYAGTVGGSPVVINDCGPQWRHPTNTYAGVGFQFNPVGTLK